MVVVTSSGPTGEADLGWTTEQVIRITGASQRRLGYWLDKGIIAADVDEARGRGRVRLWSLANLVDVRVAMWLRDRVSLDVIAQMLGRLPDQDLDNPSEELRFAVVDTGDDEQPTRVVVRASVAGIPPPPLMGDLVMEVVLPWKRFVEEVRTASEREGAKRRMVADTAKAVLAEAATPATPKVSASAIQALYYEGWPAQRIIDTFPGLTARDIREALRAPRTKQ